MYTQINVLTYVYEENMKNEMNNFTYISEYVCALVAFMQPMACTAAAQHNFLMHSQVLYANLSGIINIRSSRSDFKIRFKSEFYNNKTDIYI